MTRVQTAAIGKQGTRIPAVMIKDMTPSKSFTDLAIGNQDAVKEAQGDCALKQAKGFGDESQSLGMSPSMGYFSRVTDTTMLRGTRSP